MLFQEKLFLFLLLFLDWSIFFFLNKQQGRLLEFYSLQLFICSSAVVLSVCLALA